MVITRAKKHEPISFGGLSSKELARATDATNGSKFSAEWTLEVLTERLTDQVDALGWTFPPGANARVRVVFERPIGVSAGVPVRTITILASGRYVHAYPDKDR
jgi:hypothetical protein